MRVPGRRRKVERPAAPTPSTGFSKRISDPHATRLFFDELARQRKLRPLEALAGRVMRKTPVPAARSVTTDVMAGPRTPLVQFDDVSRAFAMELEREGIERLDSDAWEPVLVQTRISRAEAGMSSSPERQVANIAAWLASHRLRPALLLAEEVSGSIYRKRRRVLLDDLQDDIENARLRDPLTGAEVKRIACWMYDRFTRDPREGEAWLATLRAHGVDLHETYYGEAPKPLHKAEHEIRAAFGHAAKEVVRLRERVMEELERRAVRGLPTSGAEGGFGHRRVVDESGKIIGYRAVEEEKRAVEVVVQKILAGTPKYAVVRWLNDNGFRNAAGNLFSMKNLNRLLHAPRLAGLVRLRIDPRRLHDPEYEGDLFPVELMYEAGERPPKSFVAPIEPLLHYPLWLQLQEHLAATEIRRGPYQRYFASRFVTCAICSNGLKASKGGGGGVGTYRCSKPDTKLRPRSDVADDRVHAAITMAALDLALEELIFASYELRPDPADAALQLDLDAARAALDSELRELDERLETLNHLALRRTITRSRFDEELREIEARRDAARRKRRELLGTNDLAVLPDGVTLRELWPNMPLETRREWLSIVFERVSLRPASGRGARGVMERLDIVFRAGFDPPQEEREQIFARIEAHLMATVRKRRAPNALAEWITDVVWSLHEEGKSLTQIGRSLANHDDPRVRKHNWQPGNIMVLLKRLAAERGVEYVPNHMERWKVPLETRELIIELYLESRSWELVSRELNRLELYRPNGKPWASVYVRSVALRHAKAYGLALPRGAVGRRVGRKSHLSDAMARKIWRMHREGGMTYPAIARWLDERGIKTASGTARWSKATVMYTVHRVDREVALEEKLSRVG
jgi:hypothetical protein